MHTTTLRQFNGLPDRPRPTRGRLQVPSRTSSVRTKMQVASKVKQTLDIHPKNSLGATQVHTKATKTSRRPSSTVYTKKTAIEPRTIRGTSHSIHLAKTAKQAEVLSRVLENHGKKQSKPRTALHGLLSRRSIAGLASALILVSTGYVTIDTWLTNRQVAAQATNSSASKVVPAAMSKEEQQRSEGRDETPLPANALATYSVAPNKPRALYIDKLGLKARILPVGVNTDNSMQAPANVFDTGWYTGSSEPGELGAVAIDGHSSGATKLGAFGKLGDLEKGDTITIEKGDGTKIQYKVVAKETVDKDKVDMRKFLLPHGDALKGANFITCSGDWTDDNSTMKQRTVIYTEQVS